MGALGCCASRRVEHQAVPPRPILGEDEGPPPPEPHPTSLTLTAEAPPPPPVPTFPFRTAYPSSAGCSQVHIVDAQLSSVGLDEREPDTRGQLAMGLRPGLGDVSPGAPSPSLLPPLPGFGHPRHQSWGP